MAKKQATNTSAVVGLTIERVTLRLTGRPGSPLVVHAFSEKAKAEIRAKQQKQAKGAKEPRNPEAEFEAAKYLDREGRESAPVMAVKKAMVSAGTAMDNLTKVALRQAVFVEPADDRYSMMLPIENHDGTFAKGVMQEDAVTIGVNTRGLVYRPGYAEWMVRVAVEFNSRLISRDQLVALAAAAGWGVGIGEGRPEKTSALSWGRFDVEVID